MSVIQQQLLLPSNFESILEDAHIADVLDTHQSLREVIQFHTLSLV